MRISDWSSDVCSSDLHSHNHGRDDLECIKHGDPFDLALLGIEATLALLPLACLALLDSEHVDTGPQGAGAGGPRTSHRGDGPRTGGAAIGRATCRARVCQVV